MTFQDFIDSLHQSSPPTEISIILKALWFDAAGDWEKAHGMAQDLNTLEGSWIHAYLHRKEGDQSNARYWYNRAKKQLPDCSLEQEWKELVLSFLDDRS